MPSPSDEPVIFDGRRHSKVAITVHTRVDIESSPKTDGTPDATFVTSDVQNWDGPEDPENPLNWSNSKKWCNISLISAQATLSAIASTLLVVADVDNGKIFHLTCPYIPGLLVGLFVLGQAFGPLVLTPCSELYGRRIVCLASFALFTILNVGCAVAPNIIALAVLRLLSGMAGSADASLGGGTIGDMFERQVRGRPQSLYGVGPTVGPAVGGLVGGFIVIGAHGWRWLTGGMAIASGVTVILSVLFLHETCARFLLARKAKKRWQTHTTDSSHLHHHLRETSSACATPRTLFAQSIIQPLRLLSTSPICTAMSVYMALTNGILYLHLLSLPLLFTSHPTYRNLPTYSFPNSLISLPYIPPFLALLLSTFLTPKPMSLTYRYMTRRHSQRTGSLIPQPESRLLFLQFTVLIVPLGLTAFAWSAQNAQRVHWSIPLLASALFVAAIHASHLSVQTYLVDAFVETDAAPAAVAATCIAKSVGACVLCVCGLQLYRTLGWAWGTMALGFACAAMVPVPALLYWFGKRLRKREFEN